MPERRLVVKEIDVGLRLVIDGEDHGVGLQIRREWYELNELDFVRRNVRQGQHVLDVGAHVGLYAIHMAQLVGAAGTVHAFEPLDESADCLVRAVSENGFDARVTVVRQAVGRQCGPASLVFAQAWSNPGGAFVAPSGYVRPPGHELRSVTVVALDELDLPRPVSFIKIDVEGHEGEVLKGARSLLTNDRPLVLSELHARGPHRDESVDDLVEQMRRVGYRCHRLGAGVMAEEITEAPLQRITSVVFVPQGRDRDFLSRSAAASDEA